MRSEFGFRLRRYAAGQPQSRDIGRFRRHHNRRLHAVSLKRQGRDTVQWTFVDKNPHSVTADDNTLFDSTPLADGMTFAFRFDKPGSYAYHCSIHPEMHGTVVVG